ncbi:MAG: hypothetical protein II978_01105 [Clostridia bacterium]|nr:hypothetical protein [Clostridia bacterium]
MKKAIISIIFVVVMTIHGTALLERNKREEELNNNVEYVENFEEDTLVLDDYFEDEAESSEENVTEKERIFYCTDTGKRYHMGNCRYLHYSKNEISYEETKERCLTPCKICIGY